MMALRTTLRLCMVLLSQSGILNAQETSALGGCLIIDIRKGLGTPVSLADFCGRIPKISYPGGTTFQDHLSWAPPVLAFAFDEAERGLAGSITGVTGTRGVRIVLVPGGLVNAGVPVGGSRGSSNSLDILMTSSLLDFVEATTAAYMADALTNTKDRVEALGFRKWLDLMGKQKTSTTGKAGGVMPVPWPGPGKQTPEWNLKYVRTPAQTVYHLIFAHELSHVALGLPSGGATDAEVRDREIRVDRNAFRSMGPLSPHRNAMQTRGNVLPTFIVVFMTGMWYFENLRGQELREAFKVAGSPLTFQTMFPARDWSKRALALISDWESTCGGGVGTATLGTACAPGWKEAIVEARTFVTSKPPEP